MHFLRAILGSCAWTTLVVAQATSSRNDLLSGMVLQSYTDQTTGITVGFVMPPMTNPPSNEFIVQITAPSSNGWTGVSLGGSMTMSLLLTMWPYQQQVVVGSWTTSTYAQPSPYSGAILTLLPDSGVNGTHVTANIRCQGCTTWPGGSFGNGDLNSLQFIAYVNSPSTPTNVASSSSTLSMHGSAGYFGLMMSAAHDARYSSYISGSSSLSSSVSQSTTLSAATTSTSFTGLNSTIMSGMSASSTPSAPSTPFKSSVSSVIPSSTPSRLLSSPSLTPSAPLSGTPSSNITYITTRTTYIPSKTPATPLPPSTLLPSPSPPPSSTPSSTPTSAPTTPVPSLTAGSSSAPSSPPPPVSLTPSSMLSRSSSPPPSPPPSSSPPPPSSPPPSSPPPSSPPPSSSPSALLPSSQSTISLIPGPTAPPGQVVEWGQCGGIGYTGPIVCAAGNTCNVLNQYYSQCLPNGTTFDIDG